MTQCCEGSGCWGDGEKLRAEVTWKCSRGDAEENGDGDKFSEYSERFGGFGRIFSSVKFGMYRS